MSFDHSAFLVHNIMSFPVVWSRRDGMQPGFAAQWRVEMDELLKTEERFVIIFETGQLEEAHEDRKLRGLWLKHNKQALANVCLAIIAIEPDPLVRVVLEAQSALAAKAFGVAAKVAVSEDEAVDIAWSLLKIVEQ
jgi:hypothetical protein